MPSTLFVTDTLFEYWIFHPLEHIHHVCNFNIIDNMTELALSPYSDVIELLYIWFLLRITCWYIKVTLFTVFNM